MNGSNNQQETVIFWFRRDLRLNDNSGLYHALLSGFKVLPVFIFDTHILDTLSENDRRLPFIYQKLTEIHNELRKSGSGIRIIHSDPMAAFQYLIENYNIRAVYTNTDYEPYARERDLNIQSFLALSGIGFNSFKDQVIFEKNDILKQSGDPYTVFTPYGKRWLEKFRDMGLNNFKPQNIDELKGCFLPMEPFDLPPLHSYGFNGILMNYPLSHIDIETIAGYDRFRDIPHLEATSRLSLHLRFGTVSIRELASIGYNVNITWLNELQWREFFMQILWHFPHVTSSSFKPAYDRIIWRNNEDDFQKWCSGTTGYPLVDAGMRELLHSGFMHNRVRMVTASFLVKHLLIDWRWGEKWFADQLLDFELASNNGNWQWAAGSGCDAAPYFRIFNPIAQASKFDPKQLYIKKWIPEFETTAYPKPMVDHKLARQRCLLAYNKVKNE